MYNYYPLAPGKLEIKKEMLPDFQLKVADEHIISIGNVKKLVPNFLSKEKYVLYNKILQPYLRIGLKIKKVNRVLEFCQPKWLKPYIKFNTKKKKKRIEAEKNGDKNGTSFYKLTDNVVYGITIENLRINKKDLDMEIKLCNMKNI